MDDLDNLLADLEKATIHLKSNSNMASSMLANGSDHYPSPNGPTTTTTMSKMMREFKFTRRGPGGYVEEPVYENDIMIYKNNGDSQPKRGFSANISELDNLLDDLNTARPNLPKSNGWVTESVKTDFQTGGMVTRGRSDSTEANQLITQLENRIKNPHKLPWQEVVNQRLQIDQIVQQLIGDQFCGKEIKPIVLTRYYYESHTKEVSPKKSSVASSPQRAVVAQQSYSSPPPRQQVASTATKELDDLMTSLSDFKVREKPTPSDYGKVVSKPVKSSEPFQKPVEHHREPKITTPTKADASIDSMLGNLQNDLSKQGVDTTSKGICCACNKPIVGQVVTALGKTWHPEHFTCTHCGTELANQNFFERDSAPYCETDYQNLFSPRCAYCNAPILDKCVTALDQTWHPEHFFCAHCGKQFDDEGYHEKDGKPYCKRDYFDLFAPKCAACNGPIKDDYISALNQQWHPDCFVCRECRCPFIGGSFFDYEGQPYCEVHYHAKRGSLCAGCHKPIHGRCITAMFRKFHPEHFVCSFCLKQLNKGTFKEQNDKPYCHPCFDKLFG